MTFKVATSIRGKGKASALEQSQDEIMNNGENLSGKTQSHASGIFVKGDIPATAIMQAKLRQRTSRCGCLEH